MIFPITTFIHKAVVVFIVVKIETTNSPDRHKKVINLMYVQCNSL